jgi:hypothetical protein
LPALGRPIDSALSAATTSWTPDAAILFLQTYAPSVTITLNKGRAYNSEQLNHVT